MNTNSPNNSWHKNLASVSFFWALTAPIAAAFAAGRFLFAEAYDVLSLWDWFAFPFIIAVIAGMAGWALYLFITAREARSKFTRVPNASLSRTRQICYYLLCVIACFFSIWGGMAMQAKTNQFQRLAQAEARRLQAIDVSQAVAPLILADCVGAADANPDAADAPAGDQKP